jgi:hypothetical protein
LGKKRYEIVIDRDKIEIGAGGSEFEAGAKERLFEHIATSGVRGPEADTADAARLSRKPGAGPEWLRWRYRSYEDPGIDELTRWIDAGQTLEDYYEIGIFQHLTYSLA